MPQIAPRKSWRPATFAPLRRTEVAAHLDRIFAATTIDQTLVGGGKGPSALLKRLRYVTPTSPLILTLMKNEPTTMVPHQQHCAVAARAPCNSSPAGLQAPQATLHLMVTLFSADLLTSEIRES
jgi:hypothetical protein